jgi:hypothetical protein
LYPGLQKQKCAHSLERRAFRIVRREEGLGD